MAAPTFEEIKLFVAPFEGNISHMYLDSEGYVTVGIGNMLPNDAAAVLLSFRNRTTKAAATEAEIKADFEAVAKQAKGKSARKYKEFTSLDMTDLEVNGLFQSRIAEFQNQLRKLYPKYDEYPASAQLAILDMAFNMGAGGLKTKWPKLNKAIDALNWADAAEQCERPGANAVRNSGTKALFMQAAEEEDQE
jgi:GH24 family phage-related lysozyme (muramidase)